MSQHEYTVTLAAARTKEDMKKIAIAWKAMTEKERLKFRENKS